MSYQLLHPKGRAKRNAIMKISIYRAMAAMIVTLTLFGPAAAMKEVPFAGFLQGVETEDILFPTASIDGSGTGIATLLGQFMVSWEATVNLLSGSGSGVFHFIAANGDSISTTDLGQAFPTVTPNVFRIVEVNTI